MAALKVGGVVANLREWALGRPYFSKKKLLKETEFLPEKQLEMIRATLLEETLKKAKTVPFYAEYLNSSAVARKEPLKQFENLPIIDKGIVRRQLKNFCRTSGWSALKVTTGGSTGQPFGFYMDRFKTRQMEKAFIFDQWSRVGYQLGDPVFNLRGRAAKSDKFIHHDRFFNIHFASSYNLKMSTVERYVKAVDQIRPRYLHGYPSTMYQLASLMDQAGLRFKEVPFAVFCGSEKLFPYQRDLIERVFSSRVYSWYGHSECLVLGGECEHSRALHFYPQYGYVEMLPTGTKNASGKDIFEIVATGFNNHVMPLIRYRTGDYAVLSDQKECRCGRNYLLVDEVIGREQEFVVDDQGELMSVTGLIFGQHFAVYSGIDGLYLQQQVQGELVIVMKKSASFNDEDFMAMKSQINNQLVDRFNVAYVFADEIPRSNIGKARLVQQQLDINQYLK